MPFIKLIERDDWGSIYYNTKKKSLSSCGTASKDLGIKLPSGLQKIRFPDGNVLELEIKAIPYTNMVDDWGHNYVVSTHKWFVTIIVHGLSIDIPITAVELWVGK